MNLNTKNKVKKKLYIFLIFYYPKSKKSFIMLKIKILKINNIELLNKLFLNIFLFIYLH